MNYSAIKWESFRTGDKTGPERMANFTAVITRETRYIGGAGGSTTLTIQGEMPPSAEAKDQTKPQVLPELTITAEQFAGMAWVMAAWGVKAVVYPITGVRDDLRTMIQQRSQPVVETVYRQTGWTKLGKEDVFLHVGGAIGKKGNDKSVSVQLPPELSRYDLSSKDEPKECVLASLDTVKLCDFGISWPLLAATWTPLYGPVDFAVHLTGRTGSFKSELMSLYQAHFGAEFDARSLPGSWSSTPNALEALAFMAKNCVFTIDDFIPTGTSSQQKSYQGNADKIFRAQGNQAGRARLTDTIALQQTMYPRGIIMSTGEDTPEGHSVRARMLILELETGMITSANLSRAQANRAFYVGTTAWLAQSLAMEAADLTARATEIRKKYQGIGHSRTAGMLGRLIATAEDAIGRFAKAGFIKPGVATGYIADAGRGILAAGGRQASYLEDQDPVDIFTQAIRQCLATGGGFFRTLNGGIPMAPETLGWSPETSSGAMRTFKARGQQLGWVSAQKDEMYLDVLAGYPAIKKMAANELGLSKQTLFKRLKEAGCITRTDATRSRNTVRIVAENHPRQVLCMSLSTTLQQEESYGNGTGGEPDDGYDDGSDQ